MIKFLKRLLKKMGFKSDYAKNQVCVFCNKNAGEIHAWIVLMKDETGLRKDVTACADCVAKGEFLKKENLIKQFGKTNWKNNQKD